MTVKSTDSSTSSPDERILDERIKDGEFVRTVSGFRHWVTADGEPGPTGEGGFAAEPDRYHLYVALACPWAHRTLLFRALKGLESLISVDVVHPLMGSESWHFGEFPGSTPDTINGQSRMADVYHIADPEFDGVVTVPVLWDKKRKTMVNNESSEIIRMFNSAFNHLTGNSTDYYPQLLREEIDAINERIYETVNNGVYRSGFATTQTAYETACTALFDTLDMLDERLSTQQWLVGTQITEADLRLLPTLLRFDPVYHGHFKCNRKRLVDYPNLWRYTKELFALPGVANTFDMNQTKYHYYASHTSVNPTGIVPMGPDITYS